MKRPRFSLRTLLILTALLAAFCYYRDRPRQVANRFIAAIEAGHYRAAEAVFGERVGLANPPKGGTWVAEREKQSVDDWLHGRCYIRMYTDLDKHRFKHRFVTRIAVSGVEMNFVRGPKPLLHVQPPPSRRSK